VQVTHCSCHSCELSAHGPELGRQSFGFKPAILHAWWVFLGIFWLSALLEAEGDHEELLVFYYGFNTLFAGEDVASGCGMCVCVSFFGKHQGQGLRLKCQLQIFPTTSWSIPHLASHAPHIQHKMSPSYDSHAQTQGGIAKKHPDEIAGAHNECLSPHSDGSIGIYHCFPSNIASFGYVCVYQCIPYAGMP